MSKCGDGSEHERQAAVDRLGLTSAEETAYEDIVRLAARMREVPVALITILDGERQWFKARVGVQQSETPREHAFCEHAIRDPGHVTLVEDAATDPRFADNPMVRADPHIRFYAGAPLVTASGHAIGTVCVLDLKPRRLERKQVELLQFLAQEVMARLERGPDAAAADLEVANDPR